jgi:hypothetical protein
MCKATFRVAAALVALLGLATLLSCDFFVDPNALASLAISPTNPTIALNNGANKNTQQFTAAGTFGDLSQKDLTSTATWSSSAPAVATINSSGLATAVALGSTTISATSSKMTAQTTLTIAAVAATSVAIGCGAGQLSCSNSGATVTRGNTVQLTATATFSDNSQQDVTNAATWQSSNTSIATVSATGLVTANNSTTGVANITATFQGRTSPVFPVTVQ